MKITFLASLVALIAASSPGFSQDRPGVFDQEYADFQQKIGNQARNECSDSSNLVIRAECRRKRTQRHPEWDQNIRGRLEYCEAHYRPMRTDALRSKAAELAGLRRQARRDAVISVDDRRAGEVSVEDLTTEYRCVHDLLLDRGVKIGFDLGGTHIPDGEICEEIDCQPGRSATPAPAAPGASSAGNPIEDVTDALRSFNRLFD